MTGHYVRAVNFLGEHKVGLIERDPVAPEQLEFVDCGLAVSRQPAWIVDEMRVCEQGSRKDRRERE